jgi:hypothetical protein
MEPWRMEEDLGLLELSRHRPRSALGHLANAVKGCPERRSRELARILFYLGVTMRKLGLTNPALRSWIAGQRLVKRGLAGKMLARYANEYGMERQVCSEADDWQAFSCVHLGRYLGARATGAFQSQAERHLVTELIRSHWDDLRNSHDLPAMGAAAKCALFRSCRVPFPSVVHAYDHGAIPVDFVTGRRVGMDDRCVCGSGRAFRTCCGRIPGADEPPIGTL